MNHGLYIWNLYDLRVSIIPSTFVFPAGCVSDIRKPMQVACATTHTVPESDIDNGILDWDRTST